MKPILEFLLSNTNHKTIQDPSPGCDIEEIAEWLEKLGVTDRRQHNYKIHKPNDGCLLYVTGPEHPKNDTQYWISLIGKPHTYREQDVCCKPRSQSMFKDTNDIYTDISFEKAIEIMREMIDDPDKEINI